MFYGRFNSLISFLDHFKDDATCLEYLKLNRWDDKPKCPHCESEEVYHYSDNKTFRCKPCDKKFNVKTGTIFYRSHVPMRKWFIAIFLLSNHNKGISSEQLSRDIKVTQPTAWFMLQRIRHSFKPTDKTRLKGVVEVDETYVGGKNKNKHYSKRKKGTQGRSTVDKVPVFGMIERGGRVKSIVVKDVQRKTLSGHIFRNVKLRTKLMTDEWTAYRRLYKFYQHGFVHHGKYEYVNGEVHTNTIEGYWGILKRMIFGTYHWVSKKHMQKYCYESDFRYNTKNENQEFRFQYAIRNTQKTYLSFQNLIAA